MQLIDFRLGSSARNSLPLLFNTCLLTPLGGLSSDPLSSLLTTPCKMKCSPFLHCVLPHHLVFFPSCENFTSSYLLFIFRLEQKYYFLVHKSTPSL